MVDAEIYTMNVQVWIWVTSVFHH